MTEQTSGSTFNPIVGARAGGSQVTSRYGALMDRCCAVVNDLFPNHIQKALREHGWNLAVRLSHAVEHGYAKRRVRVFPSQAARAPRPMTVS